MDQRGQSTGACAVGSLVIQERAILPGKRSIEMFCWECFFERPVQYELCKTQQRVEGEPRRRRTRKDWQRQAEFLVKHVKRC